MRPKTEHCDRFKTSSGVANALLNFEQTVLIQIKEKD